MKQHIDKFWVGMIFGLLGPFIGFWIFGMYYCHKFHVGFSYYIHAVFLGTKPYQSPIATLSLLFNLILFFLFLRFHFNRTAQGIMGATLIYAPVIIFLFFY